MQFFRFGLIGSMPGAREGWEVDGEGKRGKRSPAGGKENGQDSPIFQQGLQHFYNRLSNSPGRAVENFYGKSIENPIEKSPNLSG